MADVAFKQLINPSIISDVFRKKFSNLSDELFPLLDNIKKVAPQGKPPPPAANAPKGTTDSGAKAYGEAFNKAQAAIKDAVDTLTVEQLSYLSGLEFQSPGDEKKMRTDVVNTVLAAYDKSASKYMKNSPAEGDAARADLTKRLADIDATISGRGEPPIEPDKA